jgi:two-component system CheB/CheR fusion protein
MSHVLRNPLNLVQLIANLIPRFPETKRHPRVSKATKAILGCTQPGHAHQRLAGRSLRTDGQMEPERGVIGSGRPAGGYPSYSGEDSAREIQRTLPPKQEEPMAIEADRTRMEQVVWNLVTNAMKFTPLHGSIRLVLTREHNGAVIQIVDTGQGPALEDLVQVFDLYDQAGSHVAASQRQGLGMGPSLVKQLVEALGDTVAVESAGLG